MKRLTGALLTITIVTLLICGGGMVYASNLKPTEPPVIVQPLNADIVFRLVNKERQKANLKPLVRDARLDATAQAKADEMVRLNYFGHFNPMTGKNTAWDNPKFDQICSKSGENIDGALTAEEAISEWMGSKPHHDAILDPDYTLTGMAVAKGGVQGEDGYNIVQHFCVSK